jgi:thiamine biosynthesis lipoprotein
MGTDAHLVVVGDDAVDLVAYGAARLDALERKWSRFLPASEVSRVNASPGVPCIVSPETWLLFRRGVDGWYAGDGLFDPTVLPRLRAIGYDRDFAAVAAGERGTATPPAAPAPGCAGITIDDHARAVTVAAGTEFDPGAIGKGLAADLVCDELLAAGARGALVNVGGDLRARGEPPNRYAWDVAVEDPARPGGEVARVHLVDGAVATSSRIRRRWRAGGVDVHHVIDPRTGAPARARPHATVTAVTGTAWWAEVVATVVLVGGLDPADADRFDAHVVTIDDAGRAHVPAELERCAA